MASEPRAWRIWVCPSCGDWDSLAWRCACGSNPQAIEVIERAPVEAELERLRKIEAAAREVVDLAADWRFGDSAVALAVKHKLRQALGGQHDPS